MNQIRVNLADVADKAGVSKSTASRVINNKFGNGFSLTKEIRKRVLDVAKELNYRPNLIAQSLTKQNFRMISILGGYEALGDLGNIYQTVVNNIAEVIDSTGKGYDVNVDVSRHKSDESELPAWQVDGVIILVKCTDLTLNELKVRNIPFIFVNGMQDNAGGSVVPDDVGGTRKAIQYLAELGHKKIAYAGPRIKHTAGHRSLSERHDSYIEEMVQLNLTPTSCHDNILDNAVEYLKTAVNDNHATAILAYGHMEALNLMQAAHTLGISIPEQLSLIAFCDDYACSIMSPTLSFLDLQSRKMGLIAAEMLLEKQHDPSAILGHIKVEEKLIIRETTGPVFSRPVK